MSEEHCPDCGRARVGTVEEFWKNPSYSCPRDVDREMRDDSWAELLCVRGALAKRDEQLTAATARASELEKRLRWYRAAHLLCSNEFAFVGHRDGEDARLMFLDSDENWNPILYVLCSDTFAWACADAEKAEYEDAEKLLTIAQQEGWAGLMRWVQERRKALGEQCEPIKPVAEMFATHDGLKALVAQRDTELAAMSRECEAWRKLFEHAEERGGEFGLQKCSDGTWYADYHDQDAEAATPQAAAIGLAQKLGLIAPDGKGETNG